MHFLFLAARLYPYLAVPVVVLCCEMGIVFRRKKSQTQYYFWFVGALLSAFVLFWIIFRGDLNSDKWVKFILFSE